MIELKFFILLQNWQFQIIINEVNNARNFSFKLNLLNVLCYGINVLLVQN